MISGWDSIFLSLFWVYNAISVVIFHFFWSYQSRLSFTLNGITIGGWLRDFLWSSSTQVIQSYTSITTAFQIIFLSSHFIWALSLMFLFSGRGYWQELIEAIQWSHSKLMFYPSIQPRALSITS